MAHTRSTRWRTQDQTLTVCARCGLRGSRWLRPFRHSRSAARLLLGLRLRGAAVPPPAQGLAPPVAIGAAGAARHADDGCARRGDGVAAAASAPPPVAAMAAVTAAAAAAPAAAAARAPGWLAAPGEPSAHGEPAASVRASSWPSSHGCARSAAPILARATAGSAAWLGLG